MGGWYGRSWSLARRSSRELPDGSGARAVWKVQVRGIAQPACGQVWPTFVDFGRANAGESVGVEVTFSNCGSVILEVSGLSESGTGIGTVFPGPVFVLPGLAGTVVLDVLVPTEPMTSVLTPESNAVLPSITLVANACTQSVDPSWDADDDGWFLCGGDCDDEDPGVSPSDVELPDNGVDDDYDGIVDEGTNDNDDEGDGAGEMEGDCDDTDPWRHEGAFEFCDGVDNDCDRSVDEGDDDVSGAMDPVLMGAGLAGGGRQGSGLAP